MVKLVERTNRCERNNLIGPNYQSNHVRSDSLCMYSTWEGRKLLEALSSHTHGDRAQVANDLFTALYACVRTVHVLYSDTLVHRLR